MSSAKLVKNQLDKYKNHKKSQILSRFFKTGKGEYGEGDIFIGVMVPQVRSVAKSYIDLDFKEIKKLIQNPIHEIRLTGLLILVYKYEKANEQEKRKIYKFYISNTKSVNNWDLVDLTAPKIVGSYLLDNDRSVLFRFVKSKNLWERRISILSCFAFIRQKDFTDALKISKMLVTDKHDLIHKAVGWMLREIGKKDEKVLIRFLDEYSTKMPRTMLRYAIERLDEKRRMYYLSK